MHLTEKNDSKFTMVTFLNLYILGILRAEQTSTTTHSSKTSQPSVSNLSEPTQMVYSTMNKVIAVHYIASLNLTLCSTCSNCKKVFAYQQLTFWICFLQKSYFLQAPDSRLSQRLIMLGYQRSYLKQVHAYMARYKLKQLKCTKNAQNTTVTCHYFYCLELTGYGGTIHSPP